MKQEKEIKKGKRRRERENGGGVSAYILHIMIMSGLSHAMFHESELISHSSVLLR